MSYRDELDRLLEIYRDIELIVRNGDLFDYAFRKIEAQILRSEEKNTGLELTAQYMMLRLLARRNEIINEKLNIMVRSGDLFDYGTKNN